MRSQCAKSPPEDSPAYPCKTPEGPGLSLPGLPRHLPCSRTLCTPQPLTLEEVTQGLAFPPLFAWGWLGRRLAERPVPLEVGGQCLWWPRAGGTRVPGGRSELCPIDRTCGRGVREWEAGNNLESLAPQRSYSRPCSGGDADLTSEKPGRTGTWTASDCGTGKSRLWRPHRKLRGPGQQQGALHWWAASGEPRCHSHTQSCPGTAWTLRPNSRALALGGSSEPCHLIQAPSGRVVWVASH